MNRFDGDVKMVNDIFYDFTDRQLRLWGCKFHQLILGKPSYDVIVDDKAQSDIDFFNWNMYYGETK